MNKITQITPLFAVTGAMRPEDFAAAAAAGFKSVLSNLPDGESAAHPTSALLKALGEAVPQLATAIPIVLTAIGSIVAALSHPPDLPVRRK